MGPRWAKRRPRWPQDEAFWSQVAAARTEVRRDGPKRGPRWGQNGPRWGQYGAKMGQDRANMGQDEAKMRPRWAKTGLRWKLFCLCCARIASFNKWRFAQAGAPFWELRRAEMRPRCQHSSNMSPYSLNERCSQPKPGPLRETSTVALQITIITIAVRPISWGHVGARWGHVGPMSSPIGRSFRPPLGATERNWSVLQKCRLA